MLYDWFKHIDFAYPRMLSLFALLIVLTWWYIEKYNSRQGAFKVSTTHSFTVSSFKNILRHLPFVLRLLALSCIILALARPQRHNDEQLRKGEGIDIVLSIDVSGSMLSTDFQPNRLEVAKEVAEEFIRSRPVDRIGLVIFSGESYTLCPITTDKNTLLTLVNGLRSGMLQDGTLIGEGLATAVDRLSKSNAKTKVVILLTDGKEEAPETRLTVATSASGICITPPPCAPPCPCTLMRIFRIVSAASGHVGGARELRDDTRDVVGAAHCAS